MILHPRVPLTVPAIAATLLAATGASVFTSQAAVVPVERILSVGKEGAGNSEAAAAWNEVVDLDATEIPALLGTMDGANSLAQNWLRSAVEVIAERALKAGKPLPTAQLGAFLFDTRHSPRARQQAFELIAKTQPETAKTLVPGMLSDPDPALRRAAVQRLIDASESADAGGGAKTLVLQQALGAARDVDQVEEIASALAKLDLEVDLPEHFGFLMRWKTIGPFDNTGKAGFEKVYPPENEFDLGAAYAGKDGEVRWGDFVTADRFGMVDINKAYSPLKEVVAYAFTEFKSDAARPVELRLGCKNAWKVWLNGDLLFGRDEYHRGIRIDQYRMSGQLEKGKNNILVKLCQDEQEEEWTVEWQFQLRVCDTTGTAVFAADRGPTPDPSEATGAPRRRRRGDSASK